MSEKKQVPAVSPNKLAMSRALGAAFLNHQVEQLEKSVSSNGPSSGNWRNRRPIQSSNLIQSPHTPSKRINPPGVKTASKKQTEEPHALRKDRAQNRDKNGARNSSHDHNPKRRSSDEEKDEKEADIIIVDASVLVHALYQVKKWCKEGRQEIIIIPLEALNTLDLLKKGTSPLAQRARAASRILEAQVGTNPRIRVQQDDAFVLWDSISFRDTLDIPENDPGQPGVSLTASPEWVRRTICCARWEVNNTNTSENNKHQDLVKVSGLKTRVVLAVLSSTPDLSPRFHSLRLSDQSLDTPLTPVPLPAPSIPHTNKYEPRSAGTLVSYWGARAGMQLLEIDPTATGRSSEEEDRPKRPHAHGVPHNPVGRRPSATADSSSSKVGLVERPPAVMAMMEMVAQPSKVVRVLARGEKLDPDP